MPKPQPDPDDLELYGDMTNEPNPSALRARILLRAARLYRVGTPVYNEVDELTRTILHKVDLTRQKLNQFINQILSQTQNERDQIVMKKLLVTMYTLANERDVGNHAFMDHMEAEMASRNWASMFHAAVVAKKLNLKNAPADEQDAARAAAKLIYAHRNHPYDVEAPATVLCRMLGQ